MTNTTDLSILEICERALATIVLVATIVFTIFVLVDFVNADWTELDTFLSFLEYVLNIAIGLELARLLVDYSLETLVELLAFVIARKMLLIEGDFMAVIMGTLALLILFAARYLFLRKEEKENGGVSRVLNNG